ncbi:MAG: hypothetical protein B5M55_05420, partial [Desulfococcus sp. 4484_242]
MVFQHGFVYFHGKDGKEIRYISDVKLDITELVKTLKAKKDRIEKIPDDIISKYLGAKGISAYYFIKGLKSGIDPLSP